MRGGVPIARIRGIEVRISLPWILLLALSAIVGAEQASVASPALGAPVHGLIGAVVGLGFLASAAVHELAHAFTARRFGVPVSQVVVGFVGGGAPGSEASRPPDDMLVALAGPMASFVLAFASLPLALGAVLLGSQLGAVAGGLVILGGLNLAMGILSLVPAPPLDGARVVRAIGWSRKGSLQAGIGLSIRVGRAVAFIAVGVGIALTVIGRASEGLMLLLLGWLLQKESGAQEQRLMLDGVLKGTSVRDAMRTDVPVVSPSLTLDVYADRFADEGSVEAFPVVDDGHVVGVIGRTQLRRLGRGKLAETRTADAMAKPPAAPLVTPDADLGGTAELLGRLGLDGLAVVEDERLMGVITRETIRSLVRLRTAQAEGTR